ncbi:MAG TPA: DUF4440 domain-containing protein [Chryseosolibacter sp.]|nr:DUF4440 domain-containing protein [Chryseosolibacter sp.]
MRSTIPLLIAAVIISTAASAQPNSRNHALLTETILRMDSLFWVAYNECNVEKMAPFFTDDIEFYHDKGGATLSKAQFMPAIKTGLCGNPDFRLRREVIDGSVAVFPMNNYGAIISGEHVFYINQKGKAEYLDGYGKFFHLWSNQNGEWKMSRVVSYDHGPAPYINKRKEVTVKPELLRKYSGRYESPKSGVITVSDGENWLTLQTGSSSMIVYPENDRWFFSRERDLQFEFIEASGNVKMVVHEKGNVADEAQQIKK